MVGQKKPKIAFIHYSYPPIVGGVEVVVKSQVDYLSQQGYEVQVLVGAGENTNPAIKLITIPQLKSLHIYNAELKHQIKYEAIYPPEFYDLINELFEIFKKQLSDVDLVIAHNIFSLSLNPAIGYALLRYKQTNPAVKIISWTHDFELNDKTGVHTPKNFVNEELGHFLYQRKNQLHYVAISNFLKETNFNGMFGFPPDSVEVIPNSIDLCAYLSIPIDLWRFVQEKKLIDADPLILLPSKILPHKRIIETVKIIYELKKLGKKPKLIITAKFIAHVLADPLKYYHEVEEVIRNLGLEKEVIVLPDYLPKVSVEMLRNLYSLSDLVILLSQYENFGLPLIEAGLMKTPFLCSDLKIFHEIGEEGILYVKSLSAQEIAHQINQYLSTNKSSLLFSKVKHTYTTEHILKEKFLPFIDRIINSY